MSSDELAPLSDDLRALFAAEKRVALDSPPPAATAAIAIGLAAQLANLPTAPSRTPGARLATLAKGAALLVVGVGVGAGVALRLPRAPEVRVVDRIIEAAPTVSTPSESSTSMPIPITAPSLLPNLKTSSATAPAASDESLRRERGLIERATSAIGRRDSAAALAVLDEHAHAFPKGRLTEEREALGVQALVLAGRNAEAKTRAARFRESFPNGLFLPVVDAALRAGEATP